MKIKLDLELSSVEIANAVGGRSHCNQTIKHISTDTRDLENGDLFVALKGKKFNGEDYVEEAIRLSAIPMSTTKNAKGIEVNDTESALLSLAKYYKTKLWKLKYTIGITGSVGKTTTKEFLKKILSVKYKVWANEGNKNNKIGLPLTILQAPLDTEILILEMGMNHLGEIDEMSKCALPDIAIITNIGSAHIGNLGSRENIAKAKLEIKNGMKNGLLILPNNEPLLCNEEAVFFSLDDYSDYCIKSKNKGYEFCYKSKRLFYFNFIMNERHILNCLCGAIAIAINAGLDKKNICDGISLISYDNIRQYTVYWKGLTFIIDCYNASYESVRAGIEAIKNKTGFKRKNLVLGDILELGTFSESIHKSIGRLISPKDFYSLYLIGQQSKFTRDGAIESGFPEERIYLNEDSKNHKLTANQIKSNSAVGELFFLKASRLIELEKIIDYFED